MRYLPEEIQKLPIASICCDVKGIPAAIQFSTIFTPNRSEIPSTVVFRGWDLLLYQVVDEFVGGIMTDSLKE